ncbi:hypothetical protein LEP1GSC040_2258 [Leptospira santarosai str. 2000030832]|nr:hypothetical protein LEP1GSC040_2258 [Leptospira santarosai str. 2000030832]
MEGKFDSIEPKVESSFRSYLEKSMNRTFSKEILTIQTKEPVRSVEHSNSLKYFYL